MFFPTSDLYKKLHKIRMILSASYKYQSLRLKWEGKMIASKLQPTAYCLLLHWIPPGYLWCFKLICLKKNANHSNRTKPLFLSFKAALVSLFSSQCDPTPSVQLKDWDATAQDSRYGVKSSWLLLTTFLDYILDFLFFEGYIASPLIVAALPVFPYFPLSVSFGGPCFSREDFSFLDLVRREDMVRSSFPSFHDSTFFFWSWC